MLAIYFIYICRYEDLKANKVKEVKRTLDFLNISITVTEIGKSLQDDYSTFKRYIQ